MAIIQEAKKIFDNCVAVSKDTILLKPEVRKMCERNACGNYNRNWTCPPSIPDLERIKKEFNNYPSFALVYHVYTLKNPFDYRGMLASMADFQRKLVKLKNALKKEQEVLVLGAGGCSLCSKCTYPEKPCRRPEDAIVSLEAYGIDVVGLMMQNNLKYNNGPGTVTYIGGVMYH